MNATQFLSWLDYKTSLSPKNLDSSMAEPLTSRTDKGFQQPLIMAVMNASPDSFFDKSVVSSVDEVCEQALRLVELGADIIDVGGESTKPGASFVPLERELERVLPIIERIRRYSDVCISIDTYKPEVMQEAVSSGANMINDIYALRYEGSLEMASQLAVPVCLMHMQGNPSTMQENPHYPMGLVTSLCRFFEERLQTCMEAGINRNNILLDPGFGFGKTVLDNLQLVHHLRDFKEFNLPIALGVSRKSTIGALLNKEVHERLIGSIALGVFAALQGVDVLRVHDVKETKQALTVIDAVCQAV